MQEKKKHVNFRIYRINRYPDHEVIDSHPDKFVVEVLTINNNSKLL